MPELLKVPALVHFASYEPAIGPVNLDNGETSWLSCSPQVQAREGSDCCMSFMEHAHHFCGLDWVIAGGESGPYARPSHPDWFRSLRDQCIAAGAAFHFKQWGEWAPGEIIEGDRRYPTKVWFDEHWKDAVDDWATEQDHGPLLYRVGRNAAGRLLDGREWNEFPEARR